MPASEKETIISVTLPDLVNVDTATQQTTPPGEPQNGAAQPCKAGGWREPAVGNRPIAVNDDPILYTTIAQELHTVKSQLASILSGQNELRAALKLSSLDSVPTPCLPPEGAPVGNGTVVSASDVFAVFENDMDNEDPKVMHASETMLTLPAPKTEYTRRRTSSYMGVQKRGSRSGFNGLRTKDEDLEEMREVFSRGEHVERSALDRRPFLERMSTLSGPEKEAIIDSCVGVVICVNAVFIGYSIDSDPSEADTVFAADVVFAVLFILELLLKVHINGLRGQFCGESAKLNIFDFSLIVVDSGQLVVMRSLASSGDSSNLDIPSVSLLRVLRLVRLARLLRLLRYHIFDDLVSMIGGLAGGMTTLFWAMVLYMFAIYCISLICREALGHKKAGRIQGYFNDVPRAMFTVFRCSFGDCTSLDGVPIFEEVELKYGMAYSFAYFIFIFSMTIGLFNVISAIFVDATMAAAADMRFKQKKARLQDEDLWCTRIFTFVRALAERQGVCVEEGGSIVDILEELYELDVTVHNMKDMATDERVRQALDDLDIDPEDHENLSMILDPDQNGCITVIELIDGLRSLRGDPKRSDIVRQDLLLRSLMGLVQEVRTAVRAAEKRSATTRSSAGIS
eukprot:TRINITY_DN824_c0_g1_i2.p1 TRINITY_DN824_c0_g1~~TRINITY_DN824_c0_g1_i2.p1  ORF type:complete len:668 (-),score=104.77 TRINITY_DN824_c0_g1_i2:142-2016(-)